MKKRKIRVTFILCLLATVFIISSCGGGGGGTEPAKVGSLSISTSPSGAAVYLDGEQKGAAPLNLDGISAGSHTVKASKSLYQDTEQAVVVEENKTTTVKVTLNVSAESVSTSLPGSGGQPPF